MDVKTLIISLIALNIFLGVLTLVVKQRQKYIQHVSFWVIANFLLAASYILLGLRGVVGPFLSIIVANTLMVIASVIRLLGVKKLYYFPVQKFEIIALVIIPIVFVALFLRYTFLSDNMYLRTIIVNAFVIALTTYTLLVIIKQTRPDEKFVSYFAASALLIFITISSLKVLSWLFVDDIRNLFNSTLYNSLQFLVTMMTDIVWTLTFILINNDRATAGQRASEAKFRYIAENTSDGILVVNAQNSVVYTSPAYAKQFEHDNVEHQIVTQDDIYKMIHPDDRDELFDKVFKAIEQKQKNLIYTYRVGSHKTSYIWREDHATFNYDEAGEYQGALIICRDISSRVQTESLLQMLRTAIEHSPTVVVVSNKKGQIEYVNPKFTELTGYTTQEAIGKNPRILKSGKTKKEVYQQMWQTIKSGKTWQGEFINKKKDGSEFLERALIAPIFDSKSQITNFVAIKEDITEKRRLELQLKQSEEKYRLLAENVTDVIWIYNTLLKEFTYYSSSIKSLTGFTPQEAQKQSVVEMFAPDSAALIKNEFALRLNEYRENPGTNKVWIDQFQQHCKDNSIIWVETSTRFQLNSNQEVEVLGITRNIDKRKKLQAKIVRQNEKLAELNATKDKFFGIIAHDLKTPFNTILGMTSLLVAKAKKLDPDKLATFAVAINESGKNAYKLLENLLEWSQAQTGAIQFAPIDFKLSAAVGEVLSVTQHIAQNKEIEIINQVPGDLELRADQNMLNTIIRNLITNAIKFTNRKGSITLDAEKRDNTTRFSVTDTGVGMDEATTNKLFKINEKVSQVGTEAERGTGLGLLLCQEFVKKHGGQIFVESQPGLGSRFTFTILDAAQKS